MGSVTVYLVGCSQYSKTLWAYGHLSPRGQEPICTDRDPGCEKTQCRAKTNHRQPENGRYLCQSLK